MVWRCVSRSRSPLPPRFDAGASSSDEPKSEPAADEPDSDDQDSDDNQEAPTIRQGSKAHASLSVLGGPILHSATSQA